MLRRPLWTKPNGGSRRGRRAHRSRQRQSGRSLRRAEQRSTRKRRLGLRVPSTRHEHCQKMPRPAKRRLNSSKTRRQPHREGSRWWSTVTDPLSARQIQELTTALQSRSDEDHARKQQQATAEYQAKLSNRPGRQQPAEQQPRADHVSFAAKYPAAAQPQGPFLTKVWVFPQNQFNQARARAKGKATN